MESVPSATDAAASDRVHFGSLKNTEASLTLRDVSIDAEIATLPEGRVRHKRRQIVKGVESFHDALPPLPPGLNRAALQSGIASWRFSPVSQAVASMRDKHLRGSRPAHDSILSRTSLNFRGRPSLEREYRGYYRRTHLPKVRWRALVAAALLLLMGSLTKLSEAREGIGRGRLFWIGALLVGLAVLSLVGLVAALAWAERHRKKNWMAMTLGAVALSCLLFAASTALHYRNYVNFWGGRDDLDSDLLLAELQEEARRTATLRVMGELMFFVVVGNFALDLRYRASVGFSFFVSFIYLVLSFGAFERYNEPFAWLSETLCLILFLCMLTYGMQGYHKTLRYHWLWLIRTQHEVQQKDEEVKRLHDSLIPAKRMDSEQDARVITGEERVIEMLRELQAGVSLTETQNAKFNDVLELLLKPYTWNMQDELRRINGHDYKGQRIELDHNTNKFLDQMTTSSREAYGSVTVDYGSSGGSNFSSARSLDNSCDPEAVAASVPPVAAAKGDSVPSGTRSVPLIQLANERERTRGEERSVTSGASSPIALTRGEMKSNGGSPSSKRSTVQMSGSGSGSNISGEESTPLTSRSFSHKKSMRDLVMGMGGRASKFRSFGARRSGSFDHQRVGGAGSLHTSASGGVGSLVSRSCKGTVIATPANAAAAPNGDDSAGAGTVQNNNNQGAGGDLAQDLGFEVGVAESEAQLLWQLGNALPVPKGLTERHLLGGHALATDWDADIFTICERVGIVPHVVDAGTDGDCNEGPHPEVGPLTLVGVLAFAELKFVLQALNISPNTLQVPHSL